MTADSGQRGGQTRQMLMCRKYLMMTSTHKDISMHMINGIRTLFSFIWDMTHDVSRILRWRWYKPKRFVLFTQGRLTCFDIPQVHKEIDDVMGRERPPTLPDRLHMPYLEATLMEIQRFRPVACFIPPKVASDDVEVLGHTIPKGRIQCRGSDSKQDWQ